MNFFRVLVFGVNYCLLLFEQFMKEEMELVQHMEQSEPRDTHQYLDTLEDILVSKSESIDALQETLQAFTSFRGGGRRKHIPQW